MRLCYNRTKIYHGRGPSIYVCVLDVDGYKHTSLHKATVFPGSPSIALLFCPLAKHERLYACFFAAVPCKADMAFFVSGRKLKGRIQKCCNFGLARPTVSKRNDTIIFVWRSICSLINRRVVFLGDWTGARPWPRTASNPTPTTHDRLCIPSSAAGGPPKHHNFRKQTTFGVVQSRFKAIVSAHRFVY